jgi:hypothetical protein
MRLDETQTVAKKLDLVAIWQVSVNETFQGGLRHIQYLGIDSADCSDRSRMTR